MSKDSETHRF